MEDPKTPSAEVFKAVKLARQAEELRHSDLVTAARHLWRCVVDDQLATLETPSAILAAISSHWEQTQRLEPIQKASAITAGKFDPNTSILLEGLEQFLWSRGDRNPRLSSSDHETIEMWRKKLAAWVHMGLCEELLAKATGVEQARHMLELRILSVHRAASLVHPVAPGQPSQIAVAVKNSPAKQRLFISVAQTQENHALLDRAEFRPMRLGQFSFSSMKQSHACQSVGARPRTLCNRYANESKKDINAGRARYCGRPSNAGARASATKSIASLLRWRCLL